MPYDHNAASKRWQQRQIQNGMCAGCSQEPINPKSKRYGDKCLARARQNARDLMDKYRPTRKRKTKPSGKLLPPTPLEVYDSFMKRKQEK